MIVSLALLGAAGVRLLREQRPRARGAVLLSLAVFGTGVLMLGGLSMSFEFGDFHYPSRAAPFFVSGRLIGAALLAFAALFVYGLEGLLSRTRLRGHEALVVLAFASVVTLTEITLSIEAIRSPYNWFHLR